MPQTDLALTDLYLSDETAWLESMAELIEEGAYGELDYAHLQEFLADMAGRDRREVESRLAILLLHILKWLYQPDHRSRGWQSSIIEQRQELNRLAGRGVLRNHAEAVLSEVYREAVERAVAETGLQSNTFPSQCPFMLDEVLSFDLSRS